MNNSGFGMVEMQGLLDEIYAPWVRALNITPIEATAQGFRFVLPQNPDITRDGGIVCGQAIASVADSVGVLSLSHHQGGYRHMTTVELTTHFMRPLFLGDVTVEVVNLSSGRRLATTRTEFFAADSPKICATVNCIYAFLDAE